MNKYVIKISYISIALSILFVNANFANASEILGSFNTITNSIIVPDSTFAVPVANPNSGTFTTAQSVILTAGGALSIRYTVDESIPTCSNGFVYSNPITFNKTAILKAVACYADNKESTGFLYAVYTINIPEVVTVVTLPPVGGGSPSGGGSPAVITTTTTTGGGGGSSSSSGISNNTIVSSKGDANNDNKVNILDFVILMANWGKTGSSNITDFNNDGKVDILDFVKLMANWTK